MPKISVKRAAARPERWISTFYGGMAPTSTSQTAVAGRVYLNLFEVKVTTTIDQVAWANGSTVAGNVRVGIYGPVATEETCLASPVVFDSGNIVHAGTSVIQQQSITPVTLVPGRYYLAIQFSDGTATFIRHAGVSVPAGFHQYYDRGGGFGAFTDPCPAVTTAGASVGHNVKLRGQSIGL